MARPATRFAGGWWLAGSLQALLLHWHVYTGACQGTGFGLQGLRRRLYLLFARQDLLHTPTKPDQIFITTLIFPQL